MSSYFTFIRWGADAAAGYVAGLISSDSGQASPPPDLSKLVEPITACGYLIYLAMKEPNTKVGFKDHQFIYYRPPINPFLNTQGWSRFWAGEKRDHFKHYQILDTAILTPQKWFPTHSMEAKAILRIQKLAIHGLEALIATYNGLDKTHFEKYIKAINDFKEEVEILKPEQQTKVEEKKELKAPKPSLSEKSGAEPTLVDTDEECSVFSSPAEQEKSSQARINEIMKSIWGEGPKKLEAYATLCEEVWENYIENGKRLDERTKKSFLSEQDRRTNEFSKKFNRWIKSITTLSPSQ